MTTPDPAAPAPLPTSPELEEEKVVTRRWGGAIEQDIEALCRAQHAATLAALSQRAPEGVRKLLREALAGAYAEGWRVGADETLRHQTLRWPFERWEEEPLAAFGALVQRAEAAEALARAAEGYIAVAVGDQDATAASLDAWRTYQHVKAALAPRGASEGEEA